MNPTLTAQNGNIMTGTLPANASGFNAQGDIIYNTQPNVPLGSAVMTSAPASEAYKQSAGWLANEQNQAAVRKANADLAAKTAAAEAAKGKIQNKTTQVATDALQGFVRTSNTAALSPSEQARMAQIEQITGQLQTLAQGMDARAGAQVESIIKEYQGLTQRQEVANKAYEGGTSVAGLTSGRSRYAPEIQAGVQSAAVASGIQALTDIQAKKERLIMEIENARDEKKYKTMTEAVANLKDLNKMERQAAQDMKDDFYKEQTYIRQNQDYIGKTLAPSIIGTLTGDPTHDNQVLEYVAEQNGVSAASLAAAVDDYKTAKAQAQPSGIKEYELAKSQGFKGTFMDYQRVLHPGAGTGGGNKITVSDAKTLGIPLSMVGLDEATVINSLASEKVPEWYRTMANTQSGSSLTDSALKPLWNEFRQKAATDPIGANEQLNFGQ